MSERTVHILRHGVTLCNKPGLPGDWKDGSVWVSFADPEAHLDVTCPICKERHALGADDTLPPSKTGA